MTEQFDSRADALQKELLAARKKRIELCDSLQQELKSQLYTNLKNTNSCCFKKTEEFMKILCDFDIGEYYKMVQNMVGDYNHIYEQEVHPESMKTTMKEFLYLSNKLIREATKVFNQIKSLSIEYLEFIKEKDYSERELLNKLHSFIYGLNECKCKYEEMHCFLYKLIDWFSIPTECPPHM